MTGFFTASDGDLYAVAGIVSVGVTAAGSRWFPTVRHQVAATLRVGDPAGFATEDEARAAARAFVQRFASVD